jgi:hypothetical protein
MGGNYPARRAPTNATRAKRVHASYQLAIDRLALAEHRDLQSFADEGKHDPGRLRVDAMGLEDLAVTVVSWSAAPGGRFAPSRPASPSVPLRHERAHEDPDV